jgi:hypothetical protein
LHLEEAAEQSILALVAIALRAVVGWSLAALVATPVGVLPAPALHSLVAIRRRLALAPMREPMRGAGESAGRAQEGAQAAPARMKPGQQGWPRRRCRIANRILRAHVPADKSAVVRWWPWDSSCG